MPAPRHMNWTGTSLMVGAVPNAINNVQGIGIDFRGQAATGKGDGDLFPSSVRTHTIDPQITIRSQDMTNASRAAFGTRGTLSSTLNHEETGAGIGALTFSINQVEVANHVISADHAQWAELTLTFFTRSPDGVSNPVSMTVVAS